MVQHTSYLAVVGFVVLAMVALGIRRRILLRVAVRNVGRRKKQVGLAIAGLLVATSILSGSFVIGDSLTFAIRASVFRSLDVIDETISVGGDLIGAPFFNANVYDDLGARRGEMPHVDGLGPRLAAGASILHADAELFEGRSILVGFDPDEDPGIFVRSDGTESRGSELGQGQVFLSSKLAEEIEADSGDILTVFAGPVPVQLEVLDVLRPEGKGRWLDAAVLFLPLPDAQGLFGAPGEINQIVVSNAGGVEDGVDSTEFAVAELDSALGPDHPFAVRKLKEEMLKDADDSANSLTELFVLLGTFTIIAGLMLIVSIFTMLADERKTEMGIERAIGLRRSHLTEVFTLEGFLYALASAALGAVAGLLVAAVVLVVINQIFAGEGITLALRWEAGSLAVGFALGFLLTIGTIALTSGRISRLNIVRAVRNIPEPTVRRTTRGQVALGVLLAAVGLTSVLMGYAEQDGLLFLPGMAVIVLGVAHASHRAVGSRLAFTVAGASVVGWLVFPYTWFPGIRPDISLFIAVGLLLVVGGVLLLVFNNETTATVVPRLFARHRRLQPVLKTAMAYPMSRPFRTGLLLAIFALIIFTIVVMATIQSLIGVSIEVLSRDASGGYEIFGVTNPQMPPLDFEERLSGSAIAANIEYHEALLFAGAGLVLRDETRFYQVYGFNEEFAARNGFTFFARADRFGSDREVWQEVFANPSLTIVDRSVQPTDFGPPAGDLRFGVGDRVTLRNTTGGGRSVEIVGILNSLVLRGFFLQEDAVREEYSALAPSFFLFKLVPGADVDALAKDIERLFLPWQMQTIVISAVVEEGLEQVNAFFDLLQGYLAMGLLVGIAGLGIVTLRNVAERRQEMGVLRALGYHRKMILQSLLLENSYVALLGIGLGIVLGILLSYRIYVEYLITAPAFVVPWEKILLISGVAYGMILLATASPALRAARFPPAQALRYIE